MAERKTVRFTDGLKTRVMSPAEYQAFIAGLAPQARSRIKVLSGPIDSVIENQDGELVRESLTDEQIRRRTALGETPVISGADDPKLEAFRQQEQARETAAIAGEEGALVALSKFIPGVQLLQNAEVGEETAAKARGELNAANPLANVGGNIAAFLIGGAVAKSLVGGTQVGAKLLGATRGLTGARKVAAQTATLAAEDIALETHLYAQHLLDTNQQFVAEEWAGQVGQGLILASPIIGNFAARALASKGIDALRTSGIASTLSGGFGDALTTAAVVSMPGTKQAAKFARAAAATKLVGRIFRRGKRAPGAVDEVAESLARAQREASDIGLFTPERLRRATPTKRREMIARMKELGAENLDVLDNIKFDTIHTRTDAMRSAVTAVRKQALSFNDKVGLTGIADNLNSTQQARYAARSADVVERMRDAGFGDVASGVETVVTGDPTRAFGRWAQLRLDARFKRGTTGGAAQADDTIRSLLEDRSIWGTKVANRATKVNQAIDEVVDAWENLGTHNIPKNLEDLELASAAKLPQISRNIDQLRASYAKFEELGMLTRAQVQKMETVFTNAEEAVLKGTEAFGDAVKINRARKGAAKLHRESNDLTAGSRQVQTKEDLDAIMAEGVLDEAREITKFGKALTTVTRAGASVTGSKVAQRGVIALRNISNEDKINLFKTLQDELPVLTGNPVLLQERIADLMGPASMVDPVGAQLASTKMVTTTYYLAGQMPRPDRSLYGKNLPTPQSKVDEFLEKWAASYDPLSVAYAALDGQITKGMVDAVRNTNPAKYAQLSVLMAQGIDTADPHKVPRATVAGINTFLGGMDPLYTGDILIQLQSNYAQTAAQDQVINGPRNQLANRADNPQNPQAGNTISQRLSR